MEVQINIFLQQFSNNFLDNLNLLITTIGDEIFFLVVAMVVFWCVDKRFGFKLINVYLLGCIVMSAMKNIVRRPRPFEETRVQSIGERESGYSFPSGHTAGAMSVWGSAGYLWRKNRWILGLMVLLVVLVAFSRNYIGVHTPQDVIVSIIIGLFIILFTDKTLKWIDKKPGNDLIFYTIIMIIGLILYLYLHLKCCAQMRTYNPLVDTI